MDRGTIGLVGGRFGRRLNCAPLIDITITRIGSIAVAVIDTAQRNT